MRKGTLIVLDGNDGAGKATQATLLAKRLKKSKIKFEKLDFPAYHKNFFGKLAGECIAGEHGDFLNLDPKLSSLPFAFDRFESSEGIRKALAAGKVVISDRFSSANQIHQAGKIRDEKKRAEIIDWLDHMEHDVLKIPRPNLVLYLRVPLEVSLELLTKKRKAKIPGLADGQKDVLEEDRAYLEGAIESAEWLLTKRKNWRLVECMEKGKLRSPEAIHEDIWRLLQKAVPSLP